MEHAVVPIAGMIMVLGIVLGIPLVRSYAKRVEAQARNALPSSDVAIRLDRIEQAIEAMSTEVERIAEGQRFTTKLLSAHNRTDAPQAAAAQLAAAEPAVRERDQATQSAHGTVLAEAARRS